MAWWASVAATALSTPPLSPQMAWPLSPTWARMRSTVSATKLPGVQSPRATADALDEVVEDGAALGRMHHLRVELQPVDAPFLVGDGGERRVGAGGDGCEPRGQLLDAVAVAHPYLQGGGQFVEKGAFADLLQNRSPARWPRRTLARGWARRGRRRRAPAIAARSRYRARARRCR